MPRGRPKGSKNETINSMGSIENIDKVTMNTKISQETEPSQLLQAFASTDPFQQTYFELNYPNAMSTFANYTIPTGQIDMIKKAKELREYDIVDYFLRLRCDYGLPIQAIKCIKPGQQKFYDKFVLPLIKSFARQFEYEYWSNAEIFGHYGFNRDGKPMFLVAEDPESITPYSALGIESYEIKVSTTLKQQLKKLKDQKQLDRLPDYLQNAINDKGQIKDKVILDNKNMARMCNLKSDYQLRPKPVLLKIAKSLMLREFLIDVDYANAFASQKSSITHIKCGTDKETLKQWDGPKIKAMLDLVTQRAPGNLFVATRGDVDIKPVNMDLNQMFDPKRFEECNKRILNFFGISVAYMPSESGSINNSVVFVSTKPFEQSVKTDRKAFDKFINVYFQEVNRLNGFSEIPKIIYEITNIRDSKEFREELEFLCGKGVTGYEDLCVTFNYDKDEQVKKRSWDWENRNIVAPHYEESQGLQPKLDEAVNQDIKINKEKNKQVKEQIQNNIEKNNPKQSQASDNIDENDLKAVKEIIKSLSKEEKKDLGPRYFYDDAQYRYVYKKDNKAVGFIENRITGSKGHLNIAVHSDYRGKGVASKMVEKAIKEAKQMDGLKKILWITSSYNEASISLAKKCGFKFVSEEEEIVKYSLEL